MTIGRVVHQLLHEAGIDQAVDSPCRCHGLARRVAQVGIEALLVGGAEEEAVLPARACIAFRLLHEPPAEALATVSWRDEHRLGKHAGPIAHDHRELTVAQHLGGGAPRRARSEQHEREGEGVGGALQ